MPEAALRCRRLAGAPEQRLLKLWEGLTEDLGINLMFSQRGVMNLGHTLQDMRDIERRVTANRFNGVDAEVLKSHWPSYGQTRSAQSIHSDAPDTRR